MPLPVRIRYWWNLGRIISLLIVIQVITGLILRMHYVAHVGHRFDIVIIILIDIENGILLRFIHSNGRRLLFILMYVHIFKGIYYNRYSNNNITWLIGRIIYILLILIAFLGYVLPWGQIRYWGATVISRLITTIPKIGKWVLIIIWGDYRVNNRTLNRFYSIHFLLPFLVITFIVLHLFALHAKGSTTVVSRNKIILPFRRYFFTKDLIGFIRAIFVLVINVLYFPSLFMDCENSIRARSLVTPIHIVPEWYFLFAYCILKSFERKVIGVIILLLRVALFPALSIHKHKTNTFKHKALMIIWFVNFIILTKIGAIELTYPISHLSLICTWLHFAPLLRN